MDDMSRPPDGPRVSLGWAFLAPVAVLVLVGLVVSASAGHDLRDASLGGETAARAFATLLFALGAVWLAGLLVASPLVSGLTMRDRAGHRPRYSQGVIVFLLLVSVLFMLVGSNRLGGRGSTTAETAPTVGERDPRGPGSGSPLETPPVDWVIVLSVFGVALLAFLVGARMLVRSQIRTPDPGAAREALAQILDDTLDDLRAERDPRRAVIAAYSRMERSLATFGLPRRPFEAPIEYLGRVLAALQSGSPAARHLTHLFERAKFSHHTIDPRMKDEAIDAVVALREELRAEAAATEAQELARVR